MIVRLGYVAMTLNLADCSPSGTITVSAFSKLPVASQIFWPKFARKMAKIPVAILLQFFNFMHEIL